jgi:3-oxoacyl-[acyl-carrier protein] reductase
MADDNILGISGKKALVVGGGFGMGRETALLLARAGVDVVVADMDADRAKAVQAEVETHGVNSGSLSADVTDRAQAEQLVTSADQALGGLDIVINIVGLAAWGDLMTIDDDTWDAQFAINLRHHLNVGRASARLWIDRGVAGRLAMVASVSGIYGAPFHPAYGAAKAGVMSLTRTMSQEWGAHGIRVNAVAPDVIATPRVRGGFEANGADMNALATKEHVSLCRFGEPNEIAGALVFLVSDLAGFITGQTLIVDGGVNASFPHDMNPFK